MAAVSLRFYFVCMYIYLIKELKKIDIGGFYSKFPHLYLSDPIVIFESYPCKRDSDKGARLKRLFEVPDK